MEKTKRDVSALWMIVTFLIIFFFVVMLGLLVFNFRSLLVEQHRTQVLTGQLETVTKVLNTPELLLENNEKFTNDIIEKSMSSTKLVSLAKNYWDYAIFVNGAEMRNNEITARANGGTVTVQFSEASQDRKLTSFLHNKGAVTGGDPEDVFYNHLFVDPSSPKYVATSPEKTTRLYTFNNVKSGDVIVFDLSEPLNEYLKFGDTHCIIRVR